MTHHLITTEVLGNQLDKVLFKIDPSHSSFPEFQKWASSNAYRMSVGRDMMTLPKEKALEVVNFLNQKGWTGNTSEQISEMIISESNSRVMGFAAREAAAAASKSSHTAIPKVGKTAKTPEVTKH